MIGFILTTIISTTVFDLVMRRIPNWLVTGSACFVLAERMTLHPELVWASVSGALIVGVLWWPAWYFKMIGGGDHKFIILLGLIFGLNKVVSFSLATALFGGLIAAAVVVYKKIRFYPNASWRAVVNRTSVPYGLAVGLAGLLTLFTS